jgi:hypothetical protein
VQLRNILFLLIAILWIVNFGGLGNCTEGEIIDEIKQKTLKSEEVTVEGKRYHIVTLSKSVGPHKIKNKYKGGVPKLYLDGETPVSDLDIAKKIGAVDMALRLRSSPKDISRQIDLIENRMHLHRIIRIENFLSDEIAKGAAVAIRAFLTEGATIPSDLSLTRETALTLLDPENLRLLVIYQDFAEAKREYKNALSLVQKGPITDFIKASAYFHSLCEAETNFYPAQGFLDKVDQTEKRTWDVLKDKAKTFVLKLISPGLSADLEDYLRHSKDMPDFVEYYSERQKIRRMYPSLFLKVTSIFHQRQSIIRLPLVIILKRLKKLKKPRSWIELWASL